MKKINFIDNKPRINILEKFLLFFGERLVIIVFTVVVFGFAFFNVTQTAFSENADSTFVKQENDWYSDDVSFAVVQNLEADSFTAAFEEIPTPTPTPIPVIKVTSVSDDVWEKLADCESHKNWSINTGNGYYGGLQFSLGAWASTGGTGFPHEASREEQIIRGKILQNARGWSPWGACSKKLGLN